MTETDKKDVVQLVRSLFWTLRYRQGMAGVQTGFILGMGKDEAERNARAFCAAEPNRKYVAMMPAVLNPDDILGEGAPATKPSAPAPSVPTKAPAAAGPKELILEDEPRRK